MTANEIEGPTCSFYAEQRPLVGGLTLGG